MSNDLETVFARVRAERAPQPRTLPDVRESGRRIRRRRRAAATGASALAVGLIVAGGLVWARPGADAWRVVPADPSPRPTSSSSGVAPTAPTTRDAIDPGVPSGLLQPGDLGGVTPWTSRPSDAVPGPSFDLRYTCPGGTPVSVPGRAFRSRDYVTALPNGTGRWTVGETVGVLDEGGAATARATLEKLRRCDLSGSPVEGGDRAVVIADGDGVVVLGEQLTSGAIGDAEAFAVVGRQVLDLVTWPGGDALDPDPLPGQAAWFAEVTARAVERSTGRRPVLTVRNLPTPSPAPASPGRLAVTDLGAEGHWQPATTADVPRYRLGRFDALPTCPDDRRPEARPNGIPVPGADGSGTSRVFWGWTGSAGPSAARDNGWQVVETVTVLDGGQAAVAGAQLAAAARCPTVTNPDGGDGEAATLTRVRVTSGPPGAVVATRGPDGRLVAAHAWALSGGRLVQITVRTASAAHPATVGPEWVAGVLRAAAVRAAGG